MDCNNKRSNQNKRYSNNNNQSTKNNSNHSQKRKTGIKDYAFNSGNHERPANFKITKNFIVNNAKK